jgi:hypothetical protein
VSHCPWREFSEIFGLFFYAVPSGDTAFHGGPLRHVASKGQMDFSQIPTPAHDALIDEAEVAHRLKTSIDSVRWMRRTRRLSYIKIAGNRKVRFIWPQVLAELRAAEVKGIGNRAQQLADIAAHGDLDNAECAAADLAREFPTIA